MKNSENENNGMTLKAKSNRKIILAIMVIAILLVATICVIVYKVTTPNREYAYAITLMNEQNYNEAIEIFNTLDNFKDSQDKIVECRRNQASNLINAGEYQAAIDFINQNQISDAASDLLNQCNYELGSQALNESNYLEASEKFENCLTYQDSQDKYNECIYKYADTLAQTYQYEEAVQYFEKIDYLDSQELASKYKEFSTTRFIDGHLYFTTDELAQILTNNFQQIDPTFSAKVSSYDDEDGRTEIRLYKNNVATYTWVYLNDVNIDEKYCNQIQVFCMDSDNDTDIFAATMALCINICDTSLSFSECKDLAISVTDKYLTSNGEDVSPIVKNGLSYSYLYGYGIHMLTISTNADNIQNESEQIETQSNVEKAYNAACNLTKDDLTEDILGGYSYGDLVLDSEDTDWIDNSWNTDGTVNSGALYRTMANYLVGYYIGNSWKMYADILIGFTPDSSDEFKPYVGNASTFIVDDSNPLEYVMKAFEKCESIEGTFDYDNRKYSFSIDDLTQCAKELQISEEMLGYILAMLEEYAPSTSFNGNSYAFAYEPYN